MGLIMALKSTVGWCWSCAGSRSGPGRPGRALMVCGAAGASASLGPAFTAGWALK